MTGIFMCSVHNHSNLSDGASSLAEMVEAAARAGVKYFGMTDHSHVDYFDESTVLGADMSAYKKELAELRARHGEIEVMCGLEWEDLSDASPEGFDYWIGSVHGIMGGDGRGYCIDSSFELQRECCETVFAGDADALAERYFESVANVARLKPTILGHLDLITKFSERGGFYTEPSPRFRAAALAALRAADPAATLLEINTGAMSRGWRSSPYPAPYILNEWRVMGGRVIITADAHHADNILFAYERAADAARAAGFKSAAILTPSGIEDASL